MGVRSGGGNGALAPLDFENSCKFCTFEKTNKIFTENTVIFLLLAPPGKMYADADARGVSAYHDRS